MMIDLLRKLVEIKSPSGREDELASFLISYLKKLGLKTEFEYNVVVNPDAEFWLVTHMDTVTPKTGFKFDGRYAYGTGVCDAKGSIAAILLALEKLKKLNIGLNTGIAFFREEEETGKGSEKFTREYSGKAVVMEPTSLKIAATHYGTLEVLVRIKGKPAHGSMPEYGKNAIENAIEFVKRFKKVHDFTILEMRGGSDEYAIPDSCEVRLDFLLEPDESASALKEVLLDTVMGCGDVEILEETNGFTSINSAKDLLETAIKKAGLKAGYAAMPSWTDAVNLKNAGWDVVVWGPGELAYCHTPFERISIEEIVKASRVIVCLNSLL